MSDTPNDSGSNLSSRLANSLAKSSAISSAKTPHAELKRRSSSPRATARTVARRSSSMSAVFDVFGPDSAPKDDDVPIDFDIGAEGLDDPSFTMKARDGGVRASDIREPARSALPSTQRASRPLSKTESLAPVSLLPEELVDVTLPFPPSHRLRPPPAPKLASIKLPPPPLALSGAVDVDQSLSRGGVDEEVWSSATVGLSVGLAHGATDDDTTRDSSLGDALPLLDSSVGSSVSGASPLSFTAAPFGSASIDAASESERLLPESLASKTRAPRWWFVGVAAGVLLALAAFVWLAPASWKPWTGHSDEASLLARTNAGADDSAVGTQGQHTLAAHVAAGQRPDRHHDDPDDPDGPDGPDGPDIPGVPDDPDQPAPPDDPEQPDIPDLPDNPDSPVPVNRAGAKPMVASSATAQGPTGDAVVKVDPAPKPMQALPSTGAPVGVRASSDKVVAGEKKPSAPVGVATTQPLPSPGTIGTMPFNRAAAVQSINALKASAAACKSADGPRGNARVVITFAPSGRVTVATVPGPPFAGTSVGGCVAATMRRASVPPFAGGNVTVSASVPLF